MRMTKWLITQAVYLATSSLNLAIYVLALILNPRAKRLGIYIEDPASLEAPLGETKGTIGGTPDIEMGRTGTITLDDNIILPTLTHKNEPSTDSCASSGLSMSKPDFHLPLPAVWVADGHSQYDLAYDGYSPPATPLETPGWHSSTLPSAPELDREHTDSYFPKAESSDRVAELAAYGQDEKKDEGGVV